MISTSLLFCFQKVKGMCGRASVWPFQRGLLPTRWSRSDGNLVDPGRTRAKLWPWLGVQTIAGASYCATPERWPKVPFVWGCLLEIDLIIRTEMRNRIRTTCLYGLWNWHYLNHLESSASTHSLGRIRLKRKELLAVIHLFTIQVFMHVQTAQTEGKFLSKLCDLVSL